MPARPKSAPSPGDDAPPPPRPWLQEFYRRVGGRQHFYRAIDLLADIHFFAKDCDGRFVAASAGVVGRFGQASENDVIGRTDADFHPPRTVAEIREDDRRVMSTRQPLINRVEALFTHSHAKEWYVTSKMPIFATDGEVIGVMGIVRRCSPSELPSPALSRLDPVVRHIHAHHGRTITAAELARLACVSVRQLHRLFHEVFGINTETFIVRTRVQAASDDLVLTDKTLGEIALEHGFCDQSAFSRRFREHTGESPLKFRQRRRGSSSDTPPA